MVLFHTDVPSKTGRTGRLVDIVDRRVRDGRPSSVLAPFVAMPGAPSSFLLLLVRHLLLEAMHLFLVASCYY